MALSFQCLNATLSGNRRISYGSRSKSDKYWLANCPNGQVTDAQVVALKSLSNADLDELDDLAAALPMTAVADLNQTIADPPTQAEVQAISDKVDDLLAKMRTTKLLAT